MRCFVAYGTVEGHTRRIAHAIASTIVESKHEVDLFDFSKPNPKLALKDYDTCIVAAPVYQQRHPDDVINFVKTHSEQLNQIPSALISVSLSAAFPDGQMEAKSYIDRLLETTGWNPISTHCAAGALQYTHYDFFQEQLIRHVVLQGRDVGEISGDQAFTDWDGLNRFIASFVATAAKSN